MNEKIQRKKPSGSGEEMIYIKSGSSCCYEPVMLRCLRMMKA